METILKLFVIYTVVAALCYFVVQRAVWIAGEIKQIVLWAIIALYAILVVFHCVIPLVRSV